MAAGEYGGAVTSVREKLKRTLLQERGWICEGAEYAGGACMAGTLEMHEAFKTRNDAKTAAQRKHMTHEVNEALVCSAHHGIIQHSKTWRTQFKKTQEARYGKDAVAAWLDAWPTKIGRR